MKERNEKMCYVKKNIDNNRFTWNKMRREQNGG